MNDSSLIYLILIIKTLLKKSVYIEFLLQYNNNKFTLIADNTTAPLACCNLGITLSQMLSASLDPDTL